MSLLDERFMRMALALGARNQGSVWPNPAVGCVIVRGDRVAGRGWTQPGGRPHAETEALARAGDAARGATAYVTLEPCANWGRTPPCAKALIEAGIGRVVMGCLDPDPRVDGKGLAWLREAGVEVTEGCLEKACREAHAGLYRRICDGRPFVTVKLAQTLDGRIATRTGASQWITGERARAFAHWLRVTHDAIVIGSGTALADDPALTCRLPGLSGRSPVRVVVDRRLRLPALSGLVRTAREVPVWVLTDAERAATADPRLASSGVEVLSVPAPAGPRAALRVLAERGITRALIEGGAGLASALLREGLVDELLLAIAPIVIGGDGRPSIEALGVAGMEEVHRFRVVDERCLGEDRLLVLRPASRGRSECSAAS
jgi:diaminohydroxyphosphoribosylaminopyrimidine deaminase/5-amino-6-(5-phosphoribosylamino)uracil reductase